MITTFDDFRAALTPPRKIRDGLYRAEWAGYSVPFGTFNDAVEFGPKRLFRHAVEDAVQRREPLSDSVLDMFPVEKAERERLARVDAEKSRADI